MAERLSGGNAAIALLANTIATGAALVALILTFGSISGAHFNPAVTLADALERGISWHDVPIYFTAQFSGAIAGTGLAHAMFGLRLFSRSQHLRSGPAQVLSEFGATFGLLSVIWGCSRLRQSAVPFDAPAFIAAQLAGAIVATIFFRWLIPQLPERAGEIIVPHGFNEMSPSKTYLFACVHNAGRSQMAAAFFNIYANRNRCRGIAAGTQPAENVHPEVVRVMSEIGIDVSSEKPRKLTDDLTRKATVLVTMGCGETCPFVPGLRVVDWNLPDPKGRSLNDVRAIRDDIHERVKRLIKSECAECCTIEQDLG
jgi:glycerol uptake facilitator-like aquaporin